MSKQIIELPSKGLVYDINNPLSAGVVELNYPTSKDETILTNKQLINSNKVFQEYIKALLVNKEININTMVNGDFNYLIFVARILTYDADYQVKLTHKKCDNESIYTLDLNNLELKYIDETTLIDKNKNLFIFNIEQSLTEKEKNNPRYAKYKNYAIKYRLLTIGDEVEITETAKRFKSTNNDLTAIIKLTKSIVDIIDITTGNSIFNSKSELELKSKIEAYIMNEIDTTITKKLKQYIIKMSPDVITKMNMICNNCGEDFEIDIPFTQEFFWPTGM